MKQREKIEEMIKYPVQYSPLGIYINDADNKMIADVRGWGWIQKLENPEATQDEIGQFIAEAINEKLATLQASLKGKEV